MTAREITVRALDARGEPYGADMLRSVRCSLLMTLKCRARNGVTRHPDYPRRWSLG